MKPRPVNPDVDAAKDALLRLSDEDRLHVVRWLATWTNPDGSVRFQPGRYPAPIAPERWNVKP